MVTDHEHGGYSMDDNEIGVFISIVAVVQLFVQVKGKFAKVCACQKLFFCSSCLTVFSGLHYKTASKRNGES